MAQLIEHRENYELACERLHSAIAFNEMEAVNLRESIALGVSPREQINLACNALAVAKGLVEQAYRTISDENTRIWMQSERQENSTDIIIGSEGGWL